MSENEKIVSLSGAKIFRYTDGEKEWEAPNGEECIEENIEMPAQAKQELLIDSANKLLQPHYEIRQFRPADGDAYSLFVASFDLWKNLEASNPEEVEKYFLSTDRLATFWSKGYFARLFSKP